MYYEISDKLQNIGQIAEQFLAVLHKYNRYCIFNKNTHFFFFLDGVCPELPKIVPSARKYFCELIDKLLQALVLENAVQIKTAKNCSAICPMFCNLSEISYLPEGSTTKKCVLL